MAKQGRKETVKTIRYVGGPWDGKESKTVAYDATRVPVYDYGSPLPQSDPPKGQKPQPKTFPVKGWYVITGEVGAYSGQ